MEKCTYCVQRIQNAKIEAKNDGRADRRRRDRARLRSRPARPQAIAFGDLNDPASAVVASCTATTAPTRLLAELNIKPRTCLPGAPAQPEPEPGEPAA